LTRPRHGLRPHRAGRDAHPLAAEFLARHRFEQRAGATGREIRELRRLQKAHGRGRWPKRKGIARIWLKHGGIHTAEGHWYEAHGIGRKEFKIKRILA
jgi:hypothetical protein